MSTSKSFKNTRSRAVGWVCLLLMLLSPALVMAEMNRENLVLYLPLEDALNPQDLSDDPATVTVHGSLNALDGQFGAKGLDFDGNSANIIEVADMAKLEGMTAITIEAWGRPRNVAGQEGLSVASKRNTTNAEDSYNLFVFSGQDVHGRINGNGGGEVLSTTILQDDTWYHLALVFDGQAAGDNMFLYVNGVLEDSHTHPDSMVNPGDAPLWIGDLDGARALTWEGVLDEVGIWNAALNAEDINQLMTKSKAQLLRPGMAGQPSPADKVTDVPRELVLSWTPGGFAPGANGHTVYFGESFTDVNDGMGGVSQSASHYDPGRLDFGTTYYWRVDEVNAPPDATVFAGDVWRFTTEPVSIPVETITATASSANAADMGPENTINGIGLNELDQHATAPTGMWLSGMGDATPSIQYAFDKAYKLHEMWVWNSNQLIESFVGLGAKEVVIETSLDGVEWTILDGVTQFAQATGAADYVANTTVDFGGALAQHVKITINAGYGMLPQYGLSEVRFLYIPTFAREAQPADGDTTEAADVELSWRAGREAVGHELYLGTDPADLALVATVDDNSYVAEDLLFDTTYYWQVIEINEAETPSAYTGPVWGFTTPAYGTVDSFDQYDDNCNRVFFAWEDGLGHNGGEDIEGCTVAPSNGNGGGSIVGNAQAPFAERAIVNADSSQSMPFDYDNAFGPSEATLTLDGQDWTKHGIASLALSVYGTEGNTGQLYVKINNTKIPYDEDASYLALPTWQSWSIDLTSVGADLSNVHSLAIGVDGNGAAGTLYFDDIRVYPARESEAETPNILGDVTDGLVAYYPLDEGTGTIAADLSGNAHDGTLPDGGTSWIPWGAINGAINIDGSNGSDIKLGSWDPSEGTGQLSVAMWIKWSGTGNQNQGLLSKRAGGWSVDNMLFGLRVTQSDAGIRLHHAGTMVAVAGALTPVVGQWAHVAATFDGTTGRLYVNGVEIGSGPFSLGNDPAAEMRIGSYNNDSPCYNGDIDEVRLYNRALTPAELSSN
jgi:hypothetical protein